METRSRSTRSLERGKPEETETSSGPDVDVDRVAAHMESEDTTTSVEDGKPAARQTGPSPTSSTARSNPVPPPSNQTSLVPPSQASSQGSSGSNFLSSVLNPTASTFNNTQLSHTPPAASSFEASHFGKRMRSGSVSGRLRSASEHLEEKGLLDRQTRGILKDLIIIGDEVLQQAIDRYEAGDPSALEEMVSSGALQERLPKDIDILGDLDLDFLTVGDTGMQDVTALGDIEPLQTQRTERSESIGTSSFTAPPQRMQHPGAYAQADDMARQPNMVSPPYDDGIGDLEFAGEFVSDQGDYMSIPHQQTYGTANQSSEAGSPADAKMLEYERRMRSNSLFTALLNDPRAGNEGGREEVISGSNNFQYGHQWTADHHSEVKQPGIIINKSAAKSKSLRSSRTEWYWSEFGIL